MEHPYGAPEGSNWAECLWSALPALQGRRLLSNRTMGARKWSTEAFGPTIATSMAHTLTGSDQTASFPQVAFPLTPLGGVAGSEPCS
eukprot:695950-Amphidinium_carterae.1